MLLKKSRLLSTLLKLLLRFSSYFTSVKVREANFVATRFMLKTVKMSQQDPFTASTSTATSLTTTRISETFSPVSQVNDLLDQSKFCCFGKHVCQEINFITKVVDSSELSSEYRYFLIKFITSMIYVKHSQKCSIQHKS